MFLRTRSELKFSLSDLDSNQDKRYQKPLYYPYTIGQNFLENLFSKGNANVESLFEICKRDFKIFLISFLALSDCDAKIEK